MGSWREAFEGKKTTAANAVLEIKSGQRVLIGSGCSQPRGLVQAMTARGPKLRDVEISNLLAMGHSEFAETGLEDAFRLDSFFIGDSVRSAVREGRADYTPIFLSEIPELIRSGQRRIDVALVTLSPPDRHGYCSLGINIDIQLAAVESARIIIAEINTNMPRTTGDTLVHADRISHWVASEAPLIEFTSEAPNDVAIRVGGQVARLIDNGACLQLGIGRIPNAILGFLGDKRDLGIHTEMFTEGLLELLENGVVSNQRKTVMKGKTVSSFCLGTAALYDYVDGNPAVSFHPSDFVNDPRVISQNDHVVAVNSALQVDLTGQVAADSIGHRLYSGIGGQVDFIRGAAMSRGGKPIIAMPSTANDGQVSRIVPVIDEGGGVVTSRGDVHYVVTEYGVAYLHGKSIRQRALALINIAHPDHRSELLDVVKQRRWVQQDEAILAQSLDRYPHELEHKATFGGTELLIRPLQGTDERLLQEFFYSHRPATVYNRYFNTKTSLGHREAAELCCVDYERRMALAAFEPQGRGKRIVGVARFELNPRTNYAETATVVHEDFRRMGLGSHLVSGLEQHARKLGIEGFEAEILTDNHAMVALHRSLGHRVTFDANDMVYRVRRRLTGEDDAPPSAP